MTESEYGEYEVLGTFRYRGHEPGDVFLARLDRAAESRAVRRGTVRLLRRYTPAVEQGSFRLPRGWLDE